MNKELVEEVKELSDTLQCYECVKKFLELKEAIKKDAYLSNLDKQMKYLKKCDMSEEQRILYNNLKDEYNNYPLVVNFRYYENETSIILKEVKELIEK